MVQERRFTGNDSGLKVLRSESGETPDPVRLQLHRISRVKVPVRVFWHSVTESNCVAARRGGEQLEVND